MGDHNGELQLHHPSHAGYLGKTVGGLGAGVALIDTVGHGAALHAIPAVTH
jgi:hypothetical protein